MSTTASLVAFSGKVALAAACAFTSASAVQLGAANEDLVEGVLSMAQDGVITIPIDKVDVGQAAEGRSYTQIGAQAELADEWSLFNLAQTMNLDMMSGAMIVNGNTNSSGSSDTSLSQIKVKEPLTNTQNLTYIGELYMGGGTPQKVKAIFDTGSANPWILSAQGAASISGNNQVDSFDPSQSTTFKEPEKSAQQWVKISFGSGYLRGYFVEDQVLMGSPTDTNNQLVLPDWRFGYVVEHTVFNGNFDALIGLAYPQFAEHGVTPLFDALMESGQLDKNVFSFFLSYNPDEQSTLMFGGWDEDKIDGEIIWHDVRDELFWSIKLDDVLVDGVSTGYCKQPGRNCLACPDSGTSLITFPQAHFNEFDAEYGEVISCEMGDELQYADLTFVIDGQEYDIPSHHWVQRKIDSSDSKGGKCSHMIKPLGVNQPNLDDLHILGDVFMQLYYTIHDRENNKVGFGFAKHDEDEVLVQFNMQGNLASVKTLTQHIVGEEDDSSSSSSSSTEATESESESASKESLAETDSDADATDDDNSADAVEVDA